MLTDAILYDRAIDWIAKNIQVEDTREEHKVVVHLVIALFNETYADVKGDIRARREELEK